jgi:hypothetical protein
MMFKIIFMSKWERIFCLINIIIIRDIFMNISLNWKINLNLNEIYLFVNTSCFKQKSVFIQKWSFKQKNILLKISYT